MSRIGRRSAIVLGDRPARRVAEAAGLNVIGTLCLLRLPFARSLERLQAQCENLLIDGIWRGIGRASHVVVDLTPLDAHGSAADASPNPNVCLELALAQAIGRKLLVVRDACAKEAPLFPAIAKLQVFPYESASALRARVESFVS